MGRNKRNQNVISACADTNGDDVHGASACSSEQLTGDLEVSANKNVNEIEEGNGDAALGVPAKRDDCNEESEDEHQVTAKKKEYKGNKIQRLKEAKEKKKKIKVGDGAGDDGEGRENGRGDKKEDRELVITREYPVEVLYCRICSFPAEMCEFSGMLEKCRPWLQEHAADLADAEEKGRKRRILTEQGRLQKLLEGGAGPKHAITRNVIVELDVQANKHTIVIGMDLFGFNLKDLSREWKKQFSCGVAVKKGEESNEQNRLEVQGNVVEQLGKLFVDKYDIPMECVLKVVKGTDGKKKKVNFYS